MASRILGYVRDKVIAYHFGRTAHTDAYWAAFNVPDLIYYLLAGGALGVALIPVFTSYLAQGHEDDAWRMINTLATVLVPAVGVGVTVVIIFAPQLIPITAPGFKYTPATFNECVLYVRVMAPMVFFTALSAMAGGILQSYHHFTAPALAWLLYNVGIIGGAVFLGPSLGMVGLCIGVLAGAAFMVAAQVPSLLKRGLKFRPELDLRHPGVRRFAAMFFPLMIGLAVQQIVLLWLPGLFGSYYRGGVTNLRYANRLIVLPLGLFGVSISTAAYPTLARQFGLGASDDFKRTLNVTTRTILLLLVPCSVGLALLSGPVVTLLWQGGAYDEAAARATAFALTLWAPCLFAIGALQIVNRGFYAAQDAVTPPLIGVANVAVIAGLAILFMKRTALAYGSLPLATSVALVPTLAISVVLLRRRVGRMHLRGLVASFLRVAAASAAMGAVALWVSNTIGARLGLPHFDFTLVAPMGATGGSGAPVHLARVGAQVLAAAIAGGAAFVLALALLRADELHMIADGIRRGLARRRGSASAQ